VKERIESEPASEDVDVAELLIRAIGGEVEHPSLDPNLIAGSFVADDML
jgi:hypothetical protein